MSFTADFTDAFLKTAMVKNVPRATKYQATSWSSETLRLLKRSASDMQKSGQGRKTSQLARNTGQQITIDDKGFKILLGTGVGGTQSVKYARIQDQGGVTHPRVTDKMRKWAWAMHYAMFPREIRGMGLRGRERKGAQMTWNNSNFYKGIALTKKSTLTVNIPASNWFTGVIGAREPILSEMMKPEAVLQVAERMVGGTT